MAKVALLIGVSEYEVGLNPLPAAVKDVVALERILKDSEMGDFDEVKILTNPEPQAMQYEVETLFSGRSKDDFVLLFFSGHGIKDDSNNLYFATRITRKSAKGDLIRSTAVPARFVHEVMNNSRAKRQAIILDCCFSGAFDPSLLSKDDGSVDLQGQLGAEGRVVLTSSSSTQYSFEQQGSDLSLYTRYLIEGIETGAGDRDEDGKISVRELHEYATSKVQETAPSMTPKLITLKDLGFDLVLAKAKVTDPKLRYRRQVEKYSSRGAISSIGRTILDRLQIQLKLSGQIAKEIETEVLRPYHERLDNIQRYQQAFEGSVKNEYPFSNYVQSELADLLEILGLRREDVDTVEQEIITRSQSARGEYQQKAQRYEEEFRHAVELEYPLSPHARNGLNDFQKSLGLKAENVEQIENPILAQKHQQDLERQRLIDLEQQKQRDAEQEKRDAEAQWLAAREAEDQRKKEKRLAELKQQRQRGAEQENLKPETKRQNPLELPKLPFRLSRRNFILVAGFSSVSAFLLSNIRGNSSSPSTNTSQRNFTPTNAPIATSTTASTSQPKPLTVETGKSLEIELENGLNLDMVYIPSGKFTMGPLPDDNYKQNAEGPKIQDVNVSSFYMGKYEVTQAHYQAIMGNNPAKFQGNLQNPVEQVSWNDTQEFSKKLSLKTGREFRLPSEAEWEYACRAGTTTAYSFGDNDSSLGEYAWYDTNSGSKTHPVGEKKPNPWSLYDMHGNVWEWCQDSFTSYGGESDLIRKTGKAITKENENLRVMRGGSWLGFARHCKSAFRSFGTSALADVRYYSMGFRVVCVIV
jgi:formylglycine-generating enzyme required for sulfatase activity